MRVDVIPLQEVLHHFLHDRILSFGLHLVEAPLGPDLVRRGHEYLYLGFREYCGTDVPAIHDHSLPLPESVESFINELADERYGGNRADMAGHLQCADLLLDAAVSDEGTLFRAGGPEIQVQGFEGLFQPFFVYRPVRCDQAVFHCVEGHSAIHGSGIEVEEAVFFRDQLGKGAFAGG